MSTKGGRQNTKHRVSKEARHFLGWAYKQGLTGLDLSNAIDPYPTGSGRLDSLTWDEVDRLLSAIPKAHLRFACEWLFFTGCRVGEAISATQADVRQRDDAGMYEWVIPDTTKTHRGRNVWLPDRLAKDLERMRATNKPKPDWPLLWDCEGRGFGRIENPATRITARTINNTLERAQDAVGLQVRVTAHVARHTYCTNWVQGSRGDMSVEKLSRQVGTSVAVLRKTYIHLDFSPADFQHIKSIGQHTSRAQA